MEKITNSGKPYNPTLQALWGAFYAGRNTGLMDMGYDNRFIGALMRRMYAAGFISAYAIGER